MAYAQRQESEFVPKTGILGELRKMRFILDWRKGFDGDSPGE